MDDINCTNCERPLTGGLDTYGHVLSPLCAACFHTLPRICAGTGRPSEADVARLKGMVDGDGIEASDLICAWNHTGAALFVHAGARRLPGDLRV